MTTRVLPQYLSTPRGQLFSVLQPPAETPRALLLVCPPFFHEHARSYRLFSLLGDTLANAGIAVLRFDYVGTGDSDGDDERFTLDGACSDAMAAAEWLRQRWPDVPLSIMGVRAGLHPALHVAARMTAQHRILWQPVLDWTQYMQQLEQLDAEQRLTIPGLSKGDPSRSLMGFRCSHTLRAEIAANRIPPAWLAEPASLLVLSDHAVSERVVSEHAISDHAAAPPLDAAAQLRLPGPLSQWIHEVDMAAFSSRPIRELATQLAGHLLSGTRVR